MSRRQIVPASLLVSIAAGLMIFALSATGAAEGEGGSPQSVEVAADSLPCTKPDEPTNFTAFSAGGNPLGIPLTATLRRCDECPTDGPISANYVSYIYGDCKYLRPAGVEGGCRPPLEIQTWPACQRSLADYTYEGRPYPYEELSREDAAEVAGFEEGSRLEVYSGASTIVVFANDPAVAEKVLPLLRPQTADSPPAREAAELERQAPAELAAPASGATEGELQCGG